MSLHSNLFHTITEKIYILLTIPRFSKMLLLPLKVATFFSFLLSLTEGSIYVGPGDYTENRKFICSGGNCQQSGNNLQEFECTNGANCQRNPPQGSYIIWVPSSINQMSWRMQFSRALLIQFSDNTALHIIWFTSYVFLAFYFINTS